MKKDKIICIRVETQDVVDLKKNISKNSKFKNISTFIQNQIKEFNKRVCNG